MRKRKLVVLSGAGISAESGLQTFRGQDGLWEGHRVEDVASPEGWARDAERVQRFYNLRRAACRQAQPNAGHLALVELEPYFDVYIVTQNIDDLHERAGSKQIIHLHGEILKSQSSKDPKLVFDISGDTLKMTDLCPLGSVLRPHVVWFGEAVPMMQVASKVVSEADILLVVGTSLQVYPAANLIYAVPHHCEIIVVDPQVDNLRLHHRVRQIAAPASVALPKLIKELAK
ncbi:SIR2 family NAD-dependent protein deacylase [Sphingobacterium sp. Mn56C]|uniref:SIR2 family NAD-dependent protein deacylase n=1 Tax=Sphingobacterium sp. Mn56C TaxID=3395261 RepID=UPI003BBCF645